MPYPSYSIVVIETTANNATSSETITFKKNEDAVAVYENAVKAGKRAFLYEKPQPTKFKRNNSQPFSV